MKNLILVISFLASSVAAFAQGKVSLQLDGGSAITFSSNPNPLYVLQADLGLLGMQVPTTGPLPSGQMLMVGLYGGTSSTSLSLQGSTILNPVGGTGQPPGVIPVDHITLTGIPGAAGAEYFQVRVWSSTYASYEACVTAMIGGFAMAYAAENNMFTMTPGTFTYNAITTGGGTTWAAVGNESATAFAWFSPWPEPSTFALTALGAAALLVRRSLRAK